MRYAVVRAVLYTGCAALRNRRTVVFWERRLRWFGEVWTRGVADVYVFV